MTPFNDLFQSTWTAVFVAIFGLAIVIALVMAVTFRRRVRVAAFPPVFPSAAERATAMSGQGEAPYLMPSDGERPTEDDVARATLGGTRGNAQLGAAPMTPQREKKTPAHYEPGHVA